MQATLPSPTNSNAALWIARPIAMLVILFMLFDAAGKFFKPAPVVEAFARLGFPIELAPLVGSILLALTVLYIIPKTNTFAAILLTGYLGGAVAINLRAGDPLFETIFPVLARHSRLVAALSHRCARARPHPTSSAGATVENASIQRPRSWNGTAA